MPHRSCAPPFYTCCCLCRGDGDKESTVSLLYEEDEKRNGSSAREEELEDQLAYTEAALDVATAVGGSYAPPTTKPATQVPARSARMQAWNDGDKQEDASLAGEPSTALGEPAPLYPSSNNGTSGYNNESVDGQLGYVTRDFDASSLRNVRAMPTRKTAVDTFVNESGC